MLLFYKLPFIFKVMPLFSILRWTDAIFLFAHPAKIKLVIVPHNLSDFTDTVIGIFQQALCVDHPQGEKVLRRTYLHVLFEITNEPVRTDMQRFGILRNADLRIVVFVKIRNRHLNFFGNRHGIVFAVLLLAADKQQNVVEQRSDVIFIPVFALLKFPNNFSERHLILRQCSTVKDVLIQRDAMVLQNVLNVIASKMNPEHLRVIFNIVNVLLNLFGLVKNHVAGVNDFLDSIKPEMRLARCHI